MLRKCLERGLILNKEGRALHFPSGLVARNKLIYRNYRGRATYVLCAGQRVRNGVKFRYHLMPSFRVRRGVVSDFAVFLRIHLYITDPTGNEVAKRTAIADRKHVTRTWWNDKWLARSGAIMAHLAASEPTISLGQAGSSELTMSSSCLLFEAPFGIDETRLGPPPAPEGDESKDEDFVEDSDLVAEP